jgi:homoserine dehydrogenase
MMNDFVSEIETFLEETGTTPSKFGRLALNDPGFVFRLRSGGECRPSTMEKVRRKISEIRTASAA